MQTTRALITAPVAEVVTLGEAKAHLNVTFGDDDGLITSLIAAAINHLDPAGGGWLGRALREQEWEYRLAGFPPVSCWAPFAEIALPYPPLISITSVKYDDSNGVEQTLVVNTDYRLIGSGNLGVVAIAPPYGKTWPTARCAPESVRIRYKCGYQTTPSDAMPAAIKQALKLLIGHWYENRETVITGTISTALPFAAEALLAPYRVYDFHY